MVGAEHSLGKPFSLALFMLGKSALVSEPESEQGARACAARFYVQQVKIFGKMESAAVTLA